METSAKRRLAAILAADVVGYSRLMEQDESGTLRHLRALRTGRVEPAIAAAGGRVVKLMGDGLLAEFPSVAGAVEAALAIQDAADDDESPIRLRIGINLGDVIIEDDDIYGDGVNVAARIEAMAPPGGICLSGAAWEMVRAGLDRAAEDLGRQELKNIARPVRVVRLTADRRHRSATGQAERPSVRPAIAVLPFRDIGGDDDDHFADGLRLAIQATLVRISGLFLIAPPAVARFRGRDDATEDAARATGARYVLEGAAQRSGNRIRITVSLTDTEAGRALWAGRYDRDLTDTFAVQDEITAEVVRALDVKLIRGEEAMVMRHVLGNLDALDTFYRGLTLFYARSRENNTAARGLFEKVAELQPDSPVGYSYVCFTFWLDAFMGWAEHPEETLDQAVAWAEKATAYKGTDGLAHIVLASAHLIARRHEEALATCREAVARRPSCPAANSYLANVLHYCGDPEAAIARISEAMRLMPVHPPWFISLLAAARREAGDLPGSIAVAEGGLRDAPEDLPTRVVLCSDYVLAGRERDAVEAAQAILKLDPRFSIDRFLDHEPYLAETTSARIRDTLKAAGLPE